MRVELTQGANQKASGMENASVCVVKIKNANFPKPYKASRCISDRVRDPGIQEIHAVGIWDTAQKVTHNSIDHSVRHFLILRTPAYAW